MEAPLASSRSRPVVQATTGAAVTISYNDGLRVMKGFAQRSFVPAAIARVLPTHSSVSIR